MRSLKILGLISVLGLTPSCQKQEEAVHAEPLKVVVDEIPDDIRVPVKMWDDIQILQVGLGEKKEALPEDDGGLNRETILFAPVTVVLIEHNPEVLTHQEVRIELPRGGGRIDLSKYRGENTGSYFVKFEWPEWTEMPELAELRSFYVSRARKRKIDGDIHGVGCNKYLEITHKVNKENILNGIKVNTTRERDTTALAGHFVFSVKKDHQIFLTQVTFTDSKNKELLCEEIKKP